MMNTIASRYNEKKQKNNVMLSLTVFLAVLGSSISGGSILGISISKLFLIPLLLYLIFDLLFSPRGYHPRQCYFFLLLFFFLSYLSSSIIGLLSEWTSVPGYSDVQQKNCFTVIFLYFPLIFGVYFYRNQKQIIQTFEKSLVFVVRIHLIWAFLQFALYYACGIDLNQVVFKGFFEDTTTAMIYMPSVGGEFLRVTGINHDPAFLGINLVLGSIFDKNKFWKCLYFICSLAAMSRAAILTIVFVFLTKSIFKLSRNSKSGKKLKQKATFAHQLVFVFALITVTLFFVSNDYFGKIVSATFSRFTFKDNDGSNRHFLYLYAGFNISLFRMPPFTNLFGIGPRSGGVALFNYYWGSKSIFNEGMGSGSWSVESDFSEVILGQGIIGLVLFALILYKLFKSKNPKLILFALSCLFMGAMYNISLQPLVQLCLIFFVAYESVPMAKKRILIYAGTNCTQNSKRINSSLL